MHKVLVYYTVINISNSSDSDNDENNECQRKT